MKTKKQLNKSAAGSAFLVSTSPCASKFRSTLMLGLMLTGLLATFARAQTVLVSNLGQSTTAGDYKSVGDGGSGAITIGMRFTTGSIGATVNKFTLSFDGTNGTPSGFTLKLYNNFSAGSAPTGLLGTFTGVDPTSAGNYDFVGAATLAASTSYFLVATATTAAPNNSFSWWHTNSSAEDGNGLAGWTIGNAIIVNNLFNSWTESVAGAMQFSAQTSAIPEPSTYAMLFGVVALGGAIWRRRSQ